LKEIYMKKCFCKVVINVLLLLLFFVSYSIYSNEYIIAQDQCNCEEDRILKFTNPLMEGDDVKSLQERLNELGYYDGSIDGIYGLLSYSSILDFQKDHGLDTNGVVGNETWNMLGNLSDTRITSRGGKTPQGELSIKINLYNRTLVLYSDGIPYKKYPVTIGDKETPSPVGDWYIKNKYKRIDAGPLGTRWMGLNVPWGVYGIHGTNKPWEIGVAASKGCIRLHNEYVEELFEWVDLNTNVEIIGPKPDIEIGYIMETGNTGYDVMKLQEKLRNKDYYQGYLDGNYDELTAKAVKELEAQFSLEIDGIADFNVYSLLNIDYSF
ncbi:MAG: L,D-transpeptidase family protein, partial [bacterium]